MNGDANSNSSSGLDSNSKITYHQQVSYCGKPRCRKCREGKGHGPYWYAYQTINGHTTRTYIGKNLPPGVQEVMQESVPVNRAERVPPSTLPNLVADMSTARIRLFVLGQMRLERRQQRQWQSVTDMAWQLQDVRALLGFLLSDPQRRVSREQVINALWPESDNETAYESLKRVVESLRQILEPKRGQTAPTLVGKSTRSRSVQAANSLFYSEGEWLVLADQSQIWVDADAFEGMLTSAWDLDETDEADEEQIPLIREQMLHEAEALYGGDFLPEERRGAWALARRQVLRRDYNALLLELADLSIVRGATASALEILDRLLAADAANEEAVQRFIYVFAQQKRRGEALRAYRRLEDVLQREYQMQPSNETRELYEAVLQGQTLPEHLVRRGRTSRASTIQERQTGEEAAVLPPQRGQVPGDLASWQIGRAHQSPLVGREMELESLRELFQDVEQRMKLQVAHQRRVSGIPLDTQRTSQCMVLLGEAGIGKTRLAEEVSRDALQRGWWVVWSRIYPQERGIPYHIWIEVLRRALTGSGVRNALRTPYAVGAGGGSASSYLNATQETIQQFWQQEDGGLAGEQRATERWGERGRKKRDAGEVEAGLPLQWQPLVALLPELAAQFPTPMVPMMTPEQEQLRLWEAIRDLLISASESAPLLIVLDDIQWTDGSSGELLGYLARHIYGHPVVLLATCRDTELPTAPPHPLRTLVAHMQREHTVKTLPINPLSSEEIRRLVSHLPEKLVQYIQEQAAGNPFFAEELARSTSTPYEIPSSVAAALQHRMSRLSQPCQQLLGNAAVLGGSFEFPLIAAMETDNTMADEDTVLDLLEEALQSGVLTEEGAGTRVTYHFWHPLLVNHLYDNVSALRRSRLHIRAANILQRIHKAREEEVAATITHHLVKGGAEPAQIAHFGELAGDRAYTFSAYSEAEYHYRLTLEQRGLTIGSSSSAIASAAERAVVADPHILHLLELLAECMMIRGKFADVRHLYTAILEVRGARYASSAYEIQKQALLWGEIAWTWRYMGDNVKAKECCQRGEQVLFDAGIKEGPALARLRQQLGSIYWQEGRYQEARRAAEEALVLFGRMPKAPMTPPASMQVLRTTRIQRTLEGDPVDPGSAHRLLGALAEAQGHLSEALEHLNTALVIFEQADHPRRIAHVSHDIGYVHIKKAEYEQAQAALRRAYSLAERIGDNPLIGVITSNRAELAALTGELEEAEKLYRESLAYAERMQDREYISWWNARLAYVLKDQNKVEGAEGATACIIRALSTARAMQNQPRIGTALLALANLRIAQAQPVRRFPNVRKRLLLHAQQDVERALALSSLEAETQLKCRLALAEISILLGNEEGRAQVEQVIEEARSCELAQVEALARQLLV